MSAVVHQSYKPGMLTSILMVALLPFHLTFASSAAAAPALDVPYVPTPYEVVDRMLEMAETTPNDYVIDLGSGDGRIVVAAVRDWNVRAALGIDLDPERVSEAREHAREEGVTDRAKFEQGDLFRKDFTGATVLTMYLLPEVNMRLRPVILEGMAPGTRIVSHAFNMGDWEADETDLVGSSRIYLWTVPAAVAGHWQLTTSDGSKVRLTLTQKYQKIAGSARQAGATVELGDPRLRGNEISFTLGQQRYVGKIEGETIVPVQNPDAAVKWHARRI